MSELRVVITDYTFPNLAAEEPAARRAGAQFIPNHCGSSEEGGGCSAIQLPGSLIKESISLPKRAP